jgi:hypothetical protein
MLVIAADDVAHGLDRQIAIVRQSDARVRVPLRRSRVMIDATL